MLPMHTHLDFAIGLVNVCTQILVSNLGIGNCCGASCPFLGACGDPEATIIPLVGRPDSQVRRPKFLDANPWTELLRQICAPQLKLPNQVAADHSV